MINRMLEYGSFTSLNEIIQSLQAFDETKRIYEDDRELITHGRNFIKH